MNDIQGDVRALTAEVAELKRQLRDRNGEVNANTQVVRVEGMGSMWNGIAIGIALGATMLGVGWIISTLNRQETKIQQGEAYSKAVYMLAPRFAQEIDKELDRAAKREHSNPDHYPAAERADAAASEPTATAAP